jgi:O-antigen/teichoic acid export membrane protein
VARVLGRDRFGELGVIQSTVVLFGTLAGLGLGLTSTKYIAEYRQSDPAKAGRLMGLCGLVAIVSGLLICAVVVVIAPWLAANTLAAPQLAPLLRIGSLLILLNGINGAQLGALSGFEAFRRIAEVNVKVGIVTCPLVVAGTVAWGVEGSVWGSVAATVVNLWLNHRALVTESGRVGIPVSMKGCLEEWRVLVSFSAPALISGMLAGPVNWLCNAMLVNRPHGYAEMGILNATNSWYYAVLFLPSALVSNAIPVLAERTASGDRPGLRKALALCLKVNLGVAVPVVLIGCLVSRYIMASYGTGFSDHWMTLVVALVTGGVMALQIPMGQIVIASGRMWLLAGIQILWAIIFCGGTWASLSLGALGLVGARLIAYLVHTVITWAIASRMLRLDPPIEPVLQSESLSALARACEELPEQY